MYAHVYRYIYVHIARTHERLALQWHTIYILKKSEQNISKMKREVKKKSFWL